MIRKAKYNYYYSALSAEDRSIKFWNIIASLKNSSRFHLPPQIKQVPGHITDTSMVEAFNHNFLSSGLIFYMCAEPTVESTVDSYHMHPAKEAPNNLTSSNSKFSFTIPFPNSWDAV